MNTTFLIIAAVIIIGIVYIDMHRNNVYHYKDLTMLAKIAFYIFLMIILYGTIIHWIGPMFQ